MRDKKISNEVAIKNRQSNIFVQDALVSDWMDLDQETQVKPSKRSDSQPDLADSFLPDSRTNTSMTLTEEEAF